MYVVPIIHRKWSCVKFSSDNSFTCGLNKLRLLNVRVESDFPRCVSSGGHYIDDVADSDTRVYRSYGIV